MKGLEMVNGQYDTIPTSILYYFMVGPRFENRHFLWNGTNQQVRMDCGAIITNETIQHLTKLNIITK